MKNITEISTGSRICAVIGDPVAHSLSPQIHNAAFSAMEIDMVYAAFHVHKGDLQRALNGVRSLGIRGLSVTIPHKVDIIPFLDEVDSDALSTGSVNTVVNSSGMLIGFSTDGPGAIRALQNEAVELQGKKILILGSGGASRAIAFSLRSLDPLPRLSILGIDESETATLVADLNRGIRKENVAFRGDRLTRNNLEAAMREGDILIHASPVGMNPHTEESLVPKELFREGQIVFDVVYTPRETKLLRQAGEAGAIAISGLGMFINQAGIQFELWTGSPAPVKIMTEAVEKALYLNDR